MLQINKINVNHILEKELITESSLWYFSLEFDSFGNIIKRIFMIKLGVNIND